MYRYRPLETPETIRVLILDPATSRGDPLICSIVHHQRDLATSEYCAMSYAWGRPVCTRFLQIRSDNDNSISKLKITTTVDALLRRMRALGVRRLWIDCVCLNQQDAVEKASQIPLMGQIYRAAQTVHVWLGEHDRYTQATLKALTWQSVNQFEEFTVDYMMTKSLFLNQELQDDKLSSLDMSWGIMNFPNKPWFSRRWVIQEICLAREALVHCGDFSIPFQTLLKAAQYLREGSLIGYGMIARMQLPQASMSGDGASSMLLDLLYKFDWGQCSDKRDRIAAFQGILSGSPSQIDLEYNVHWAGLYKQTAVQVLSHRGAVKNSASAASKVGLNLLHHRFDFGPIDKDDDNDQDFPSTVLIPSWIPNWSSARGHDFPYRFLDQHGATLMRAEALEPSFETITGTSVELWENNKDMLHISWDAPTDCDYHQHYCQRVASVITFEDIDTSSGNRARQSLAPLLRYEARPNAAPRDFDEISLVALISTVAANAPWDKYTETDDWWWSDQMETHMNFSLGMLRMLRPWLTICRLERDCCGSEHNDEYHYSQACSANEDDRRRGGPFQASFAVSTRRVIPGDSLIPLWKDHGPFKEAWPEGFGDEDGNKVSELSTMIMLVARDCGDEQKGGDMSTRRFWDDGGHLITVGRVVGYAIAIYVDVGGDSFEPVGKPSQRRFRRCSTLVI